MAAFIKMLFKGYLYILYCIVFILPYHTEREEKDRNDNCCADKTKDAVGVNIANLSINDKAVKTHS